MGNSITANHYPRLYLANCSLEDARKLGEKIQLEIFHNNNETVYDIVP
jgi:hypothetical protein